MYQPLRIGTLNLANNILLAPMAGVTNLPMRLMARDFGAALCFTEMVSVNGLVREGKKTFEYLKSSPEDRPLGAQIFGDDPELLARAAMLVTPHADLIDINMGCPVRKVVATGAGSALLRDIPRVTAIIRAVRKVTTLPLTIKIRSGWQNGADTFLDIGRIAEEEGCDAITLHPRSRSQMFEGRADWQKIADLKRAVRIPVIGSGDLFTPEDVVAMLQQTGCDAVMIARGALGNPWIFSQALALLGGKDYRSPAPAERQEVGLKHLEAFVALAGEHVAVREMRKHLAWYVCGMPGAARFRGEVNRIASLTGMRDALTIFFTEGEAA